MHYYECASPCRERTNTQSHPTSQSTSHFPGEWRWKCAGFFPYRFPGSYPCRTASGLSSVSPSVPSALTAFPNSDGGRVSSGKPPSKCEDGRSAAFLLQSAGAASVWAVGATFGSTGKSDAKLFSPVFPQQNITLFL